MTAALVDPLVMVVAGLFVKATVVMALAVVVHAATTRWLSAAGRHLVTVVATSMLLALPVLSFDAAVVVAASAGDRASSSGDGHGRLGDASPTQRASAGRTATRRRRSRSPDASAWRCAASRGRTGHARAWGAVAPRVYALGLGVMGVHLLVQRWRVHRLGREARAVDDGAWLDLLEEGARTLDVRRPVRLLRSHRSTMPMTFGTLRPAILLPATADTWDRERRRAVVLHELAHVARFDCLAQWAACAMRAVYWCHPGAWWLASRLQVDREFACDDLVLAAGAPPREYAGHLLDIAYSFGGGRAPALAVRMARRSQLEGRLHALLDGSRDRRRPSRPARLATTAGAFAVLLPLASATQPVELARPRSRCPARSPRSSRRHHDRPRRRRHSRLRRRSPARAVPDSGCTWDLGPGSADTLHLGMRHGRSNSGRNVAIDAARRAVGDAARRGWSRALRHPAGCGDVHVRWHGAWRRRGWGVQLRSVGDVRAGAGSSRHQRAHASRPGATRAARRRAGAGGRTPHAEVRNADGGRSP